MTNPGQGLSPPANRSLRSCKQMWFAGGTARRNRRATTGKPFTRKGGAGAFAGAFACAFAGAFAWRFRLPTPPPGGRLADRGRSFDKGAH